MKNNLTRGFLIIDIILWCTWCSFMILIFTMFFDPNINGDMILSFVFGVGGVSIILTDVYYLFKNIWKKEPVFARSFILKTALFMIMFSIGYLTEEIYEPIAAVVFGILGVIFGVVFIYVIRPPKVKVFKQMNSNLLTTGVFDGFNAKKEFDFAFREYEGVSPSERYTEEDLKKVTEYASTPFIYFFMWLLEHDYFSESFVSQFDAGLYEDVRNGYVSPITLFSQVNYYLRREDLNDDILPFVDHYFTHQMNNRFHYNNPIYVLDYYSVVHNEQGIYYCLPYSYDTYRQLCLIINDRYADFQYVVNDNEIEQETDITFTTEKWPNTIRVTKIGEVSDEYIYACIDDFKSLSKQEYERMKEKLYSLTVDDLEAYRNGSKDILDEMEIDEMVVYEPKGSELAYILCGEAEFEEEHGIQITVFNGVILEAGYRYDYDNPWSKQNQLIYKGIHKGVNFRDIVTLEDLKEAYDSHQITTTYVMPIRFGGVREPSNVVYITNEALEIKRACEDMLSVLLAKGYGIEVQCFPNYTDGYPIPSSFVIRAKLEEQYIFYENIYIWD